jgi:hypothetical protein
MDRTTLPKNLKMTRRLKADLRAYCQTEGVSMSAVVGSVITEYADYQFTPATRETRSRVDVKYTVPLDYDVALERSKHDGIPFARAIRAGLERKLYG